ncbi:hypothetical protein AWB71_05247 [Caballeronia peredens]|nr:hypothetical protein AWB71_05247 [Caballeronia peredens]
MLIKVTRTTTYTVTESESLVVEASSREEALSLFEDLSDGAYYNKEKSAPKENIISAVLDTRSLYKLAIKQSSDRETFIVYSPSLKQSEIKVAVLEQHPAFHSITFSGGINSLYIDCANGTVSAELTVLEEPAAYVFAGEDDGYCD